ncbi:MAG TPA: hypothetical protein VH817_23190, partial [Thermoleophilaceae bacterium]
MRLVIDELRTDVTKTRKDGSRGRLRIDYGDHRNPEAALAWLWKFVVCRVARYAESARDVVLSRRAGVRRLGIITAPRGRRAAGRGAGSGP